MSVQRFELVGTVTGPAMEQRPEGDWVDYDDHAAALAAKDERIEELERAARGGNAIKDTATMLRWLADRLVTTHVERRQAEIIRCAYERAAMLDAALQPAAREGGE